MKRLYKIIAKRALLTLTDQRGVALVASLMILTSLAVLGVWGINSNLIDYRVTSNYRDHTQAYYAAEAGLERAREYLKSLNFSTELQNAAGGDNQMVNSTNVDNFPGDDIPIYSGQTIGNSTYAVYITNDAADGVTNSNDTNGRITITAFGTGPDGSTSVVQAIVAQPTASFTPVSPVVLPGPSLTFRPGRSNAWLVDGNDAAGGDPATAVTVSNWWAEYQAKRACRRRCDQVIGAGGTPSIDSDPGALNQAGLDSIQYYQDLYNDLKSRANYTDPNDPGFNLGTETNPEIVVIDGDFDTGLGSKSGQGILFVTGRLTVRGEFDYKGVILVVGEGEYYKRGGGTGTVEGSIIVADINGRDGTPFTADDRWESPEFVTSGGGSSSFVYNSDVARNPMQNDTPRTIAITQKYGQ
ncbi:MAG TPA: pilus assembly PilX N-terminal domain-containing protein [Nitrospinota bacterium]|nr:pilus assembly PilX N-terminal domain-containing protein [Nitrospinota bacterium]